jgi:uncharacterized membrane protein YidH (DUF202 family)
MTSGLTCDSKPTVARIAGAAYAASRCHVERCGGEMERYLPGAILAVCGVAVYAIGCVLFLAQRRQHGRQDANKSLFVYSIVLMVIGFAALGAGLFALEVAQYHAVNG